MATPLITFRSFRVAITPPIVWEPLPGRGFTTNRIVATLLVRYDMPPGSPIGMRYYTMLRVIPPTLFDVTIQRLSNQHRSPYNEGYRTEQFSGIYLESPSTLIRSKKRG